MPDVMMFPDTVEEFMESYKVVDVEHIYSNGVEFVPINRMRQWFQHQPERKKGKWIPVTKIYKVTDGQFPQTHIEWVDATEPDEVDGVRCSECGTVYDFIEARNWCSECGARMER